MATVISRLFEETSQAKSAARQLAQARFPRRAVQLFKRQDKETAKSLAERLVEAGVAEATAKAYARKLDEGGAILVVHAGYKPLTAKTIALGILAGFETVDMGKSSEETWVQDKPEPMPRILEDHPRFFTPAPEASARVGRVSEKFGLKMLSDRKPMKTSVIKGGRRMSRAFWPRPLLREGHVTKSLLSDQGPISDRFSWAPLLKNTKREPSVIKGGALVFSDALGLPTILRR